jgi:uncharacterized OsmC-like protein
MTTTFTDYDLRAAQRPLKDRYRAEPKAAHVTLRAVTSDEGAPIACQLDLGHGALPSEAHVGVGGPGTAPCSGDLLLGSLAACAQITCQMVATAMGIPVEHVSVTATGDLDLRGTLGIARDVPIGFEDIRLNITVVAPDATAEQLASLRAKTEQYCVVMQTLTQPPSVTTQWA